MKLCRWHVLLVLYHFLREEEEEEERKKVLKSFFHEKLFDWTLILTSGKKGKRSREEKRSKVICEFFLCQIIPHYLH
jgi:hypothetical protein